MTKVVDLHRLACSTITFRHLSLEEALRALVELRIGSVEIAAFPHFAPHFDLFNASATDEDRLVDLVRSFPLEVCSFNTSIGAFNDAATDLGLMADAAGRVIRVARRLEAKAVGVSGGKAIDRDKESVNEHILRHGRGLKVIAQMAQEAGLRMSIEAPHGGSLVQNASEALALLTAIDHPNACLIFDTAHHHRAGWTMDRAVAAVAANINHVHLRDRIEPDNAYPLGAGQVDFASLFAALDRLGYQGLYSFELPEAGRTLEQAIAVVGRSIEHLRSLHW